MSSLYQIAEGQEQFEPELKRVLQSFAQSSEIIYQGRNEIKRMLWHGVPVIVKAFKVPGSLRGLIYGKFRKAKAQRSFKNALELKHRAITTPAPIGFMQVQCAGALKQSFYVCHEWPASFTLREPLLDSNFPNRKQILQAFGRFSWILHSKQVFHQDFSPGNVLIKSSQENPSAEDSSEIHRSAWDFCLVDINRMRFEALSLEGRMRNFAMLWADDEDLKIIIQAYTLVSGDNLQESIAIAIQQSYKHKQRANRKERIKSLLRLS